MSVINFKAWSAGNRRFFNYYDDDESIAEKEKMDSLEIRRLDRFANKNRGVKRIIIRRNGEIIKK